MRINTNISAMNTYSRLTSANTAKSGSLAKLSSGLRINKAGDDAAGLAISEKMKNQISGMTQASRNAQDGISLIQTAEGALSETHSILNRMRDLTVQAKNGTNTDEDTSAIQKEMDSLSEEIGRIAKDTQFNSKSLLTQKGADGKNTGTDFTFQIGANAGQEVSLTIKDMSTTGLGLSSDLSKEVATRNAADAALATYNVDKAAADQAVLDFDTAVETGTNGAKAAYELALTTYEGSLKDAAADTALETATIDYNTAVNNADPDGLLRVAVTTTEEKAAASLIVSDEASTEATNNIGKTDLVSVSKLKVANTVDAAGNVVGDELTAEDYDKVIETIDSAIKSVSEERANLGATQNRLDHTVSNLATTKENLSEANSRIRDVDMAEEMMSFTKSNILSQAATSMLAQANQMPQGVLQLLQ